MGDGRHRQDPGGHSRYLIAGIGILVVLALLAIGAYALYSVLTASSGPQQAAAFVARPSARADDHTRADGPTQRASAVRQSVPSAATRAEPSSAPTLTLTVTGTHSYVAVSIPNGQTLLNGTLKHDYTATFRESTLTVTVGDPSAVEVRVNGQVRNTETKGIDTFTVSAAAPQGN